MKDDTVEVPLELLREVQDALNVAEKTIDIAGDWHAPDYYDIPAPEGWEDIKDPNCPEPDWLPLWGIRSKLKAILAKLNALLGE